MLKLQQIWKAQSQNGKAIVQSPGRSPGLAFSAKVSVADD